MSETNYWKVGLFVALGIALGLGAVAWLGAVHFDRDARPAVTFLDESVQGMEVGSPVKFRGVTIGSVTSIGIAEDRRKVAVGMDIYVDAMHDLGFTEFGSERHEDGPFLPDDFRVRLAAAGITGIKFLEVDRDRDEMPQVDLGFEAPWAYIPAEPSTLKSFEDQGLKVLESLPEVTTAAAEVMRTVSAKLDQFDVPRMQGRVEGALQEMERALKDFDVLIRTVDRHLVAVDATGLEKDLRGALVELRKTGEEVRGQLRLWTSEEGALTATVEEVRGLSRDLREGVAAARIGETSASFREAAGSVAQAQDLGVELQESLVVLREALEAVRSLATRLDRDPGILLRGNSGDRP